MDNDLSHLLSKVKFLNLIPENARLEIFATFKKIVIKPNEILFKQGTPSDYVYILTNGQLMGYLTTHANKEKIITIMNPYEIIGELSALSGEPRSLSIKAVSDSELLKIPSPFFEKICQEHPAILIDIVKTVITRSQETIHLIEGKKQVHYVVFFPGSKEMDYFEEFQSTFKNNLTDPTIGFLDSKDFTQKSIHEKLKEFEHKYNVIIIFITFYTHIIFKIALVQQISFFLVVNSKEKEYKLDNSAWMIMNNFKHIPATKPSLIILHPDNTKRPQNTQRWLNIAEFNLHHHIRMHKLSDYQRLFRFAFGSPIGVVLSGGGTRVWVHCGVLKALIAKKIPIDLIGGSSCGAWAAAGFARKEDLSDLLERFAIHIRASYKSFTLSDVTWPIISLFSGHYITETIKEDFKDYELENLWTRSFCMTSNFTTYQENVHLSGYLWEKVRASISIPGILPPFVIDGDIHFDGGLMNNLPVDVMKTMLGIRGRIIASKLGHYESRKGKYDFPPVLKFKDVFLTRFGLNKKAYKFPHLLDTIFSAVMMGSTHKENENSLIADMLINPDLTGYGFLRSYNKAQEAHLIQIGYDETIKALEDHKKLFQDFI